MPQKDIRNKDGVLTRADRSLRYITLSRLEAALRLLVERYGPRTTLAEMLAITTALARLCKQRRVTIAEIAEATGQRKQNISRWAQKRVGRSILLETNADDQRTKELVLADPQRAQDHIERLAETLGIEAPDS